MKLKFVIAAVASLSMLATSSFADQEKSERFEKNTSNASSTYNASTHKVKASSNERFENIPNSRHEHDKKHPVHQIRMGDH